MRSEIRGAGPSCDGGARGPWHMGWQRQTLMSLGELARASHRKQRERARETERERERDRERDRGERLASVRLLTIYCGCCVFLPLFFLALWTLANCACQELITVFGTMLLVAQILGMERQCKTPNANL